MGHAGYHDAANADPTVPVGIVSDIEYQNSDRFTGAATYFKYRAGPVTIVNSVWDGKGLRWACVEGESVPGPAILEGNCHMLFRPRMAVRDFYKRAVELGVSQHWLVVSGSRAAALALLCDVLDIEFVFFDT